MSTKDTYSYFHTVSKIICIKFRSPISSNVNIKYLQGYYSYIRNTRTLHPDVGTVYMWYVWCTNSYLTAFIFLKYQITFPISQNTHSNAAVCNRVTLYRLVYMCVCVLTMCLLLFTKGRKNVMHIEISTSFVIAYLMLVKSQSFLITKGAQWDNNIVNKTYVLVISILPTYLSLRWWRHIKLHTFNVSPLIWNNVWSNDLKW